MVFEYKSFFFQNRFIKEELFTERFSLHSDKCFLLHVIYYALKELFD